MYEITCLCIIYYHYHKKSQTAERVTDGGSGNSAREPTITEKRRMASINIFTAISLTADSRNSTIYFSRRRQNSVTFAVKSSESPPEKPEIELEFIGVSIIYNATFNFIYRFLIVISNCTFF